MEIGLFIGIIISAIYCLGFGLLGGYINEKKGCNYWTGFWCSFLFGVLGLIIVAVQKDKNQSSNNNNTSNTEELKKYKELLDNEVITQEEFEAKKKQLLGL